MGRVYEGGGMTPPRLQFVFTAEEFDGLPEGGEEFFVVADEEVLCAHEAGEALGADEQGAVELELAVLVLALLDQREDAVDGGTQHVDLMLRLPGRHLPEGFAFGVGVVTGVEAVLEGVGVAFLGSHGEGRD